MSFSPLAAAQSLLPQKLLGRLVYRASRSRLTWLRRSLIAGFCRLYAIDLAEALEENPASYACFNDFFTRALKPGARPLEGDEATVVSPVDGRLTEFGTLDADRLVQAKGRYYSLAALLAESPALLENYFGGSFATIYLAPSNYHRVHAPLAGQLDRARYVPGRRFSVNEKTAAAIEHLFARNERIALWLSCGLGYAIVVMVGALNVASLSTAISGEIESSAERLYAPEAPLALARGAEIGRFNLGSTVVMVFPRGRIAWLPSLETGQAVKMGQALGRFVAAAR